MNYDVWKVIVSFPGLGTDPSTDIVEAQGLFIRGDDGRNVEQEEDSVAQTHRKTT